jgi:hypothetical protein
VSNHIHFLTYMPGGLEKTIADIFSMICKLDGVDHAGIYIYDRRQRQLDLVCHYNLPGDFLARVVTFDRDSWQLNKVLKGPVDFDGIQHIPLATRISYEQMGIRELAIIPLVHRGQVVGCMNIASQTERYLNSFEKIITEGLAVRISRTVALYLAHLKLSEENEKLKNLMAKLKRKFRWVIQTSQRESPIGMYISTTDEIDGLSDAIFMATEKIMEKLNDGQRRRELPFLQKKVDAMLQDIELIIEIIGRLRVFCNSQAALLERGMLPQGSTGDMAFLGSMVEFYRGLEVLVKDDKKNEPVNAAYFNGHFQRLTRPVGLADLKFRIDRLVAN